MRVKMRHVNITFAVNWDNCSSAINEIFIKVAAMEDGYLSEVCKLTHSRRECSVSTGTSDCRCLTPVGPVSFVARVGEDEQTFVWTWQYQGSSKEETTKTVVFSREPTVHRNSSKWREILTTRRVVTCCSLTEWMHSLHGQQAQSLRACKLCK